jgi:hypothetical protein
MPQTSLVSKIPDLPLFFADTQYGLDDLVISGTTAEISRQGMSNLAFRWMRVFFQKRFA